jgi:hypothetical protein
MQTKELLLAAMEQSYQLVMPLLEDLRSAQHIAPTGSGGNHAHWVLGHLVHSEGQFRSMMQGIENPAGDLKPLFAGGSQPDAAATNYPPYEDLLRRLGSMHRGTVEWLQSITESELDHPSQIVPPGYELFFGTWRACLLMKAMHWMNHRGQLACCRRAAARTPMMA